VGLIEEAARRLEQLKRAGVEVPQGEGGGTSHASAAATTEVAAPHLEGRAHAAESPFRTHPPQPSAAAPAAFDRDDGYPVRRSRQIELDLEKLAAAGFITPNSGRSNLADELRVIKRPLLGNAQGKSASPIDAANLVMVTSALPGEGKTFVAINLALSIAMEIDTTVLLVDADVARPAIPSRLNLPPSKGLLDLLTNKSLDVADVLLRTNIERLSILPAGKPHSRATELLASEGMTRLVEELASRYQDRILIFDAPPLLPSTESRVLATHMGQVVMVVEANRTKQSAVTQALAAIEACPVVMLLLNKIERTGFGGAYYGYYGGYGQYGSYGQ
jgi:exopolysaccharide/PEP-CTERM locus tyrosine autokinase